jgi:hypothetical protein
MTKKSSDLLGSLVAGTCLLKVEINYGPVEKIMRLAEIKIE